MKCCDQISGQEHNMNEKKPMSRCFVMVYSIHLQDALRTFVTTKISNLCGLLSLLIHSKSAYIWTVLQLQNTRDRTLLMFWLFKVIEGCLSLTLFLQSLQPQKHLIHLKGAVSFKPLYP